MTSWTKITFSDSSGRPHRQDADDARLALHQALRRTDQQVGGEASPPSGDHGRVAQSPEHLALLGESLTYVPR